MKVKVVARVLLILVLGASLAGLSCKASKAPNTINFASRTLTNDTWGAPPDETLTSGVYLNKDKTYGWYWERKDPKSKPGDAYVRPIYPNVRIGGNLSTKTNNNDFPVKLSDVKSLRFDVDYEYTTIPDGSYNLAYEILLSDQNKPGPNLVPRAEVMIWLQATYPQPSYTFQGDFTDGNNSYTLYSWVMPDGRLYASFIMKDQPQFRATHTVNARKLIDNLTIDTNWYIHGVELGNEVIDGAGKIKINSLNINLNGSDVKGKLYWWQKLFK